MYQSEFYKKKEERKQKNKRDFNFGAKTGKALTTKYYVYWLLAADLSGIDEATIKAFLFAIEAFYEYHGPDGSFYKEFPRPGTPGKMDPHLCASAIIDLFQEENRDRLASVMSATFFSCGAGLARNLLFGYNSKCYLIQVALYTRLYSIVNNHLFASFDFKP
jgi:hypothetical protein